MGCAFFDVGCHARELTRNIPIVRDVVGAVDDFVSNSIDAALTPIRVVGQVVTGEGQIQKELERGFGGAIGNLTSAPIINNSSAVKNFLEDTPGIDDLFGEDLVKTADFAKKLNKDQVFDPSGFRAATRLGIKTIAAAGVASAVAAPSSSGELLLQSEQATQNFGLGLEGISAAPAEIGGNVGLGVDTGLLGSGLESPLAFTAESGLATIETTGLLGVDTALGGEIGGSSLFSGLGDTLVGGFKEVGKILGLQAIFGGGGEGFGIPGFEIGGTTVDGGGGDGQSPGIVEVGVPLPVDRPVFIEGQSTPVQTAQPGLGFGNLGGDSGKSIALALAGAGVAYLAWRKFK